MMSELVLLTCALVGCAADAQPLGTFSLTERFGVAHPEQPVEFAYTRQGIGWTARMIGPDGQEVPFQQLSSGNILVRTLLPASRPVTTYRAQLSAANDVVTINLNLLTQAQPRAGDVIRFGTPAPGGLVAGANYFLKVGPGGETFRYQLSTRRDLADTVDLTANGEFTIQRPGWILDASNGSYFARAHGYRTGDPLEVASTGALPLPLAAGTPYFVIRVGVDHFRLAATRADALAGRAIATQTAGSGVFSAVVRWTWRLETGVARVAPAQPVRMTAATGAQEITNGWTGVRVVTPTGNPAPFQRAPIQGIRLSNGAWTATGPNLLYESYSQRLATIIASYSLRVTESGPLLIRMVASYTLNRPEYSLGGGFAVNGVDVSSNEIRVASNRYSWTAGTSLTLRVVGGSLPCGLQANRLYWPLTRTYDRERDETLFTLTATQGGTQPVDLTCAGSGRISLVETMNLAGTGRFEETISVFAGQKSVVVESDSDAQLQYFLNFHQPGVFEPNQARWRGHEASGQACGYSLQGGARVRYVPYTDAFVDLPQTAESSYICAGGLLKFAPVWHMANSGRDTGWYWQMYQAGAARSAPTVAYYLGRPSRLITPLNAGPGLYTNPAHFAAGGRRAAGITFHVGLRSADARSTQRTRREWMIYTGTVGELRDPAAIQPIANERNALAYINLTKLAAYQLEYGDPAGGWPAPFTDKASYQQMVTRVRTDAAYRQSLFNAAPELRDLLTFWQQNSAAATEVVVSAMEQFVDHWQEIMVNGDGPFDPWWRFYQPALVWQPQSSRVLAVLNSDAATPAQKARVKAVAAFVANVLWDNDYAPWDVPTGEGAGNANQGLQYSMYRAQSTWMLAGAHRELARTAATAQEYVTGSLGYLHPESGAPRGTTHYHTAAMDPALANFLLMKANGLDINQYPVWKGYGRWMLDALTPPEPRFGNVRKFVSLGDGNTAASPMPGMLATLMRGVDNDLSGALQWGWEAQNSAQIKTFGQFSAPSALVIDEAAKGVRPDLRSAHYKGYWSVFRHGFATPNETAAWFANGSFYTDHRHVDQGQLSIYAHAAPLAIDWNANLYYPPTGGAMAHNRIVYEDDIGLRWNADNMPLMDAGGNPFSATGEAAFTSHELATQAHGLFTGGDGTQWRRSVTMVAADSRYPAILVRDQFAGPRAQASKVLTWNLMAEGAVTAPGGTYPPVERLNTGQAGAPNRLPSSGLVLDLAAGPQRFLFRGQSWAAHATKGIDWDLFLVPNGAQSFFIGNWGHSAHSGREMGEYQRANGQPFTEEQHILRVRGTGDFTTLILPYRKGETPAQRTVTQEACGLRITQTGLNLCVGEAGYQFSSAARQAVASFGAQSVVAQGVILAGGPTEVVITGTTVRVNVSGPPGPRTVTLPGTWGDLPGWTRSGSVYRMNYAGGRTMTAEGKR